MHSISFIKQNEFELWNELWQKYLKFYQTSLPDSVTKVTWERIMDPEQNIFSFGGYWAEDGTKELVGFTNFLYHSSTWSEQGYCYLEDLYVEEKFRGKGVGRLLIEAVWDDCQHEWLLHPRLESCKQELMIALSLELLIISFNPNMGISRECQRAHKSHGETWTRDAQPFG